MVIGPGAKAAIKRLIPKGGFDSCTNGQAIAILGSFMNGATTRGAAQFAAIGARTLQMWRHDEDALDVACANAIAYANRQVVQALYDAATIPGRTGTVNVSAAIFWLKNRDRQDWRDVVVTESVPTDPVQIPTTDERMHAVRETLQESGVLH